jgi:hypothetical protein
MEWTQFSLFFIGVFGLFIWNRTESRADVRHIEALIRSIQEEMKDFHGRLCAIEERNKEKK